MLLKRSNALIVEIFKIHSKTAQNVEFNLLHIFVKSAIYLTTTMKKRKFITAQNVAFADAEASKTPITARLAIAV